MDRTQEMAERQRHCRIGRLARVGLVTSEMARIYRLARWKELDVQEAKALVSILATRRLRALRKRTAPSRVGGNDRACEWIAATPDDCDLDIRTLTPTKRKPRGDPPTDAYGRPHRALYAHIPARSYAWSAAGRRLSAGILPGWLPQNCRPA